MIVIDPSSSTPAFEQIKNQLALARASGVLPANHRLPSVRALAAQIGLAPNTVARAYKELEAEGIIETRGRHGSFITGTQASRSKQAAHAASEYVARVKALGIGRSEASELVERAW